MSERSQISRVEAEAVYLMREAEAEKKKLTVRCDNPDERERIERLAKAAFFPEKVKIEYFNEMNIKAKEYRSLHPNGQERTLLFHVKKGILKRRAQLWHLYNGETKPEEELIIRPDMGLLDKIPPGKTMYKIITCGGVDDGKSTLIGRLLYESMQKEEQEKIKQDAQVLRPDGTVDYAMLSAWTKEEAEQGITVSVSYSLFESKSRSFLMADTPGHEEYTRNMAFGASGAQAAVIMIAADKGIVPQTRRHTRICTFMGIHCIIFAVNKMDLMDYSSQIFMQICNEIIDMMQEYPKCILKIIPVAAKKGENITQKTDNMRWYTGETLLETLENISMAGANEQDMILCVQRICKSSQMEGNRIKRRTIQGDVASGILKNGDEVTVCPTMESARVTNLHVMAEERKEARAGEPVSFELDKELDISRGYVVSRTEDIGTEDYMEAEILWMCDQRLKPGSRYQIKIGTGTVFAALTKISYQTDVNTGEHIRAGYLMKNALARCEFSLQEKIPLTLSKEHSVLGTFLLIDRESCETVGCGNITRLGILEEWEQEEKPVTRKHREDYLGQKAYILLFEAEKISEGMMNRIEQRLMLMGFHTLQIHQQEISKTFSQVQALFEAGIVVLIAAQRTLRDQILSDMQFENRVMVFEEIEENRSGLKQKLKSIQERLLK